LDFIEFLYVSVVLYQSVLWEELLYVLHIVSKNS